MASAISLPSPILPSIQPPTALRPSAADHTLLEIDSEMDQLFDRIADELEETGEASPESKALFDQLCDAFGDKVDRIGRFIRVMEARTAYCKGEAARLSARARTAENKVEQTKNLVLYFLQSREVAKMEGKQFTLRRQKNSQDTVRITAPDLLPMRFKRVEARFYGEQWDAILAAVSPEVRAELFECVHDASPMNEAIKHAVACGEDVPGASVVRGYHVRVA